MKTIQVKGLAIGEGIPKVAVPVTASTIDAAAAQCAEAAREGADLIELRADNYPLTDNPEALLEYLRLCRKTVPDLPLIFTTRTNAEGGNYKGDAEGYFSAVLNALKSGCADLIDIEFFHPKASELIPEAKKAGIPIILSNHDFQNTPPCEEMARRLKAMEEMGADLAKIACMPAAQRDVWRTLLLSAASASVMEIPVVAISMGEAGQISRLSCETYGSAFTFGCLKGEGSAPGQYEARELKDILRKLHETALERKEHPILFLTGFMGAGKSTVGKMLSKMSGMPLIEADEEIERKSGRTIPEIFAESGEDAFRDIETQIIAELYDKSGVIVSCGGGAVLREENRAMMRALGRTVLLDVTPAEALRRLSEEADGRPKLKNRMTVEGIADLMHKRRAAYEAAADEVILTDGLSAEQISSRIALKALVKVCLA